VPFFRIRGIRIGQARMGIYSRDYIREDYGPGRRGGRDRNVVKALIIANAAVFVLQLLSIRTVMRDDPEFGPYRERTSIVQEWLELDPQQVLHGQIWRLSTYDFLHDMSGIWHLLFNMWVLYLAGRKVEQHYGSREFLLFYLAAGVISGIAFVLWALYLDDIAPAIGASGAVAAVMIVYALTWPNDVWMIFGIIPVRVIWIAIITAALDLHPLLLQLGDAGFDDGVAHSAHVGGMLFGLLYQQRGWRLDAVWSRIGWPDLKRTFRPRTKLRVYHPEDTAADLERRVDELLKKVQEHGEASLTADERAVLIEASRRYRERR
jgi:membrane associated rhomboid family serine protease